MFLLGFKRRTSLQQFKSILLAKEIITISNRFKTSKTYVIDKEDLKKRLTSLQYLVTQESETERAYTGCYDEHFEKGTYHCIVCNEPLFSSDHKYNSGCGWPAFDDVLEQDKVSLQTKRYRQQVLSLLHFL